MRRLHTRNKLTVMEYVEAAHRYGENATSSVLIKIIKPDN